MEPIGISIELGVLLVAAVGAVATYLHDRHSRLDRAQAERLHRERMELQRAAALPTIEAEE